MTFAVAADAYDRFMGRFSGLLADPFLDRLAVAQPQQVLDVGCGPGALTAALVQRLGTAAVAAADPSEPFVAAVRERLPGVEVRTAAAEDLPYPDTRFDAALAQLVVHFMTDPVTGLREMTRVTRPGGTVAATVWDYGGDRSPLSVFWTAVHELDPAATTESELAGVRPGHLEQLFTQAGLAEVDGGELDVAVRFGTFEEWWTPYTLGVGPAGAHVARLNDDGRERLRERCHSLLPTAPFDVRAWAWCATGRVR